MTSVLTKWPSLLCGSGHPSSPPFTLPRCLLRPSRPAPFPTVPGALLVEAGSSSLRTNTSRCLQSQWATYPPFSSRSLNFLKHTDLHGYSTTHMAMTLSTNLAFPRAAAVLWSEPQPPTSQLAFSVTAETCSVTWLRGRSTLILFRLFGLQVIEPNLNDWLTQQANLGTNGLRHSGSQGPGRPSDLSVFPLLSPLLSLSFSI